MNVCTMFSPAHEVLSGSSHGYLEHMGEVCWVCFPVRRCSNRNSVGGSGLCFLICMADSDMISVIAAWKCGTVCTNALKGHICCTLHVCCYFDTCQAPAVRIRNWFLLLRGQVY